MKLYDKKNNRLIYIKKVSDPNYWDNRWGINRNIRSILKSKGSHISKITESYISPSDGLILEGGCGKGHYVASFKNRGYKCIGVDYAKNTVNALNKYIPELDIRYGDVRALPFPDNYFIGYWSLGVIEHFWEGYESIIKEMYRVLNKEGYLFVSFPCMSWLRKIKGALGFYNEHLQTSSPENFYQFALNINTVIKDFENKGFKLIKKIHRNGLKGTKDEIVYLKRSFEYLYNYNGKFFLMRVIRKLCELCLSPLAGHSVLLIFKKIN